MLQKGLCNANAANTLDTPSVTATISRCVACGDAHPSGKYVTPKQQLECCSCGGNHTANYPDCSKWKEAKAAAARREQGESGRKDGVSTRLPAPESAPAEPSPEQEKLGPGWNHVVRGGRVAKVQATPNPTPTSSSTGRRTERQLPQRAANVSPLVLKCPWWILNHPVPNILTQHPILHKVSPAQEDRRSPLQPSY
jgi:hypothetical protein